MNQKGIAHLTLIGIALVGIAIGLFLVKNPQVFSPKAQEPSGSGYFVVDPNPCYLSDINGVCTINVAWVTEGIQGDVYVKVRETGSLFASGPAGPITNYHSFQAPWINKTPLHMDLYSGNRLLNSVMLQGTTTPSLQNHGNGYITASPNPCILNANGHCSSKISWEFIPGNASEPEIRIKETGALFAQGFSGTKDAPWIGASGYTFQMYISSEKGRHHPWGKAIFVKGASPVGSPSIRTVPSGTCTLGANGLCTVKVIWDATNANHPGITTEIKVRETGGSFLGRAGVVMGEADAPWIGAGGINFDLYVDDQLYGSVFVKGQ